MTLASPTLPAPRIRRLLVANPQNTSSDYPLSRLDWRNWWVDRSCGLLYLHVKAKGSDTCHRVMCRYSDCPGIGMHDGRLFWMVP